VRGAGIKREGSRQRAQGQRAAGSKRRGRPATNVRAAASEHDSVGSEREGGGQRTPRAAGNELKVGEHRTEGRQAVDSQHGGGGQRARGRWVVSTRVRVASASTGVGNEGEGSEHVGNTHKGMGSKCTGVGFEYGNCEGYNGQSRRPQAS
jgi:hypothetical protein